MFLRFSLFKLAQNTDATPYAILMALMSFALLTCLGGMLLIGLLCLVVCLPMIVVMLMPFYIPWGVKYEPQSTIRSCNVMLGRNPVETRYVPTLRAWAYVWLALVPLLTAWTLISGVVILSGGWDPLEIAIILFQGYALFLISCAVLGTFEYLHMGFCCFSILGCMVGVVPVWFMYH